MRRLRFLDFCRRAPPVLHRWFTANFLDPTAWAAAVHTFTLSSAAWSMVGHVVGIGDRHGDNILLDTRTGECVHVDFDCLFGKGLILPIPEIVPFRLTPNMIDAFGVAGTEGKFRKTAEVRETRRAHSGPRPSFFPLSSSRPTPRLPLPLLCCELAAL